MKSNFQRGDEVLFFEDLDLFYRGYFEKNNVYVVDFQEDEHNVFLIGCPWSVKASALKKYGV